MAFAARSGALAEELVEAIVGQVLIPMQNRDTLKPGTDSHRSKTQDGPIH